MWRSGIEGAEHQIPKMERMCGVRNSPPDGADVRCAEHQIRVRCPALSVKITARTDGVVRIINSVSLYFSGAQVTFKKELVTVTNLKK